MQTLNENRQRGREAIKPGQIPRLGWRDIFLRVKQRLKRDNLAVVCAGVAFFALLALFPGLAAMVSLYGLVADPADIQSHFMSLSAVLPAEAQTLIGEQLTALIKSNEQTLGLTALLGLAIVLFSAMKGLKALVGALNIAYGEVEKRGFVHLHLTVFLLTLGAVLYSILAFLVVIAMPAIITAAGVGVQQDIDWLRYLRWPIMLVFIMLGLALLYKFGPSRRNARIRWVTPGAVLATVLWLLVSIGFSLYVSHFGNYNQTYGSLGAMVILLLWFYLTAYSIVLGAEVNAEMEHQTQCDTTVGKPKPMGQRDAYMADTLGHIPKS